MPATRLSRNEFAPVHTDECDRTYLDVPDPIPVVTRIDDLRAITGQADTLFGVAWKAYRDLSDEEQDIRPTSFWDVIAQVNLLIDSVPILETGDLSVETGTTLRIPNIDDLLGSIRVPPRFFDPEVTTVENEQ